MRVTRQLLVASAFTLIAAFAAPSAHAEVDTAKMWKAKCASCHGPDGKGKTKQGEKMGAADMTTEAWKKEFTDDKMKAAIADGLKRDKDGKKQEMKGFKGKLSAEEVDALVAFMKALK